MTATPTASQTRTPTTVNPPGLFDPTPLGYSQAVIAPAGCRLAHVSGQAGTDAAGALSPDFAAQVAAAYANLAAALAGLGAAPRDVVKLTLLVVDHHPARLGTLTEATLALFGAAPPAQTLVPVPRLALDGMLFEVDAVVALA